MPADLSARTRDAVWSSTHILEQWNQLDPFAAASEILSCCGSKEWARKLAESRPVEDAHSLLTHSDEIWQHLAAQHWEEAFATHPRIGASNAPQAASTRSAQWSQQEQGSVSSSSREMQERLARANDAYEHRFGRTYIVCATGRTAAEMLAILERRLANDPARELQEAVEQQRLITRLRLQKWLHR